MRRTLTSRALRQSPRLAVFHVSKSVKEEEKKWEEKKKEAASKGFGRRDSVEDKVLMGQMFEAPESIGGGVVVANLPPKQHEPTEFDAYQLSTTDFSSLVTPHGTPPVKTGLGAGFGAREDKRLGFLRPRQPLQPYTGSTAVVPKFDENGLPLEQSLTPEQMMRKRKEYMKTFEGTTMSASEHFLLVDLDFQKDAMLFGTTREEFEHNVTKLKNVIIAYNKWERTDNFYRYMTVLLKLLTLWILMESLQQFYELRLFAANYDDFVEAMEMDIAALVHKRAADFADAARELQQHKPDFAPVLEAIAKERDRVVAVEARANKQMAEADMANSSSSSSSGGGIALLAWEALGANIGRDGTHEQQPASTLSPLDVKADGAPHPMDTTNVEEHRERQRRAEEEREMRRLALYNDSSRQDGVWWHVWKRVKGVVRGQDRLPEADVTRYSYAASPTSITSMRALRRILLPRSEDVVQVVREEMVAYKAQKEQMRAHPL
ncbi:putative mitochondrial hypothetical protein [Leptomonas pyrrhocoris]|uniref:Uncharacterized protein n=1 Tax=Leptomonas pyrrhocoris TaxID=157538 RepID=A0A0N1J590_LEPPY|nr:putative mitochondrial hypothetical protein [Leptomonas pyrrhocoris]XP_015662880.1 putative mitochondrial hypothetical protein [Leptomonas pyrrhocoris]KPA84440.1 putative mitochondrial hypothetical protein [Leptomonas pyrrhocoris]KPA84441.1 putative mitochondrial hypothetical protein [Leptomonas pyrrhocoris]|eukprot:XP_015662879.1 putative mitochondrial hypothetical protein [Leptomonas pyrrhocoris]